MTHFEESLEHDVDDFVLLVDIVELNQVLQRVHLVLALHLKQLFICTTVKGAAGTLPPCSRSPPST